MSTDSLLLAAALLLLVACYGLERRRPGFASLPSYCGLAAAAGLAASALLDLNGDDWHGLPMRAVALLATAAIYALLAVPAARAGQRDLASVLELIAAVTLAAGAAYLLHDERVAIVYALAAAVLGVLAEQWREPRLQIGAVSFLLAAAVDSVGWGAPPSRLLHGAAPTAALPALAAVALAAFSLSRYVALDYLQGDALDERISSLQWRLRLALPWLVGLYVVYGLAVAGVAALVDAQGQASPGARALIVVLAAAAVLAGAVAVEGYRRLQLRRHDDLLA